MKFITNFPEPIIQTIPWIRREHTKTVWVRKWILCWIPFKIPDGFESDGWRLPFFLWWRIHPFLYPFIKIFIKHDYDCCRVEWFIKWRFLRLLADVMLAIWLYEVRKEQILIFWYSDIKLIDMLLIYMWVRLWSWIRLIKTILKKYRKLDWKKV